MKDERLMRMAMLLKAMDDTEREFTSRKTEFKDTMTKLSNELAMLKYEVLSGQEPLPIDFGAIADKVAERVNAGALDKEGVKVTAEVRRKVGE